MKNKKVIKYVNLVKLCFDPTTIYGKIKNKIGKRIQVVTYETGKVKQGYVCLYL
ncbi:protein of unknown function [Petrocella atlantisensis]|uniref:Uncharacterized protein n=1 Tax=Petrocella atlantisensis TaxID=2173034 RepID=A0A3P7PBX8_9FIRM|nr:protein of unknown function [Petrocella atlantisensis]